MKRAIIFVACIAVSLPAIASAQTLRTQRPERDRLLDRMAADDIAHRRALCASGEVSASVERVRAAGFNPLSAGASCITVLTRAGRDGTLHYVSQQDGGTTASIAFDTGFVKGFLTREAVTASTPSISALLPVADRCLAQQETNLRACSAVGLILGARAARGELVPVLER